MEFARYVGLLFLMLSLTIGWLFFILIAFWLVVRVAAAMANQAGERLKTRAAMATSGQKTDLTNQLSEAEVERRLRSYRSADTTDELYSFGLNMVQEAMERYHRYDSKATKIAGYSGAVVALLLSQLPEWSKSLDWWATVVLFSAALVALVAAGLGLGAIALREIPWHSPRDWFREEFLENSHRLRQYHIFSMYTVRQAYIRECAGKARRVEAAYWTLLIAGVLLLVALLDGTARKAQYQGASFRSATPAAAPKTSTGSSMLGSPSTNPSFSLSGNGNLNGLSSGFLSRCSSSRSSEGFSSGITAAPRQATMTVYHTVWRAANAWWCAIPAR